MSDVKDVLLFRANDGHGVAFDVTVTCKQCNESLPFELVDQVGGKGETSHVFAAKVWRCGCVDGKGIVKRLEEVKT